VNIWGPILLSLSALFFTWVMYLVWVQRDAARMEAEREAEKAQLARRVSAVSHDLQNLLQIIAARVDAAPPSTDPAIARMVDEIERAVTSAYRLVDAARGKQTGRLGPGSAEGVVRLAVGLLRDGGAPMDLEVRGDLEYRGTLEDALQVVQNLLVNAVRETREIPGARVRVVLAERALRITNRVRDAGALTDAIWEEGTTGAGSTGLGLAIVRERAAGIGWSVRFELDADIVTFTVEPA
jgi:signal transduction histidine kinase